MSALDELLQQTRQHIVRVGPVEAARLQRDGALLVDTRPVELRRRHGEIPGSLVVTTGDVVLGGMEWVVPR